MNWKEVMSVVPLTQEQNLEIKSVEWLFSVLGRESTNDLMSDYFCGLDSRRKYLLSCVPMDKRLNSSYYFLIGLLNSSINLKQNDFEISKSFCFFDSKLLQRFCLNAF